ncbi:MAG: hypothetical protein P8127_15145, partial [Acidobacteriota bacterium]
LSLWIESSEDKEDRRFEEQWNITVPARLKIRLDHDVGDIEVDGVVAGVELDSGVGDVAIEVPEGNVNVDLGVGTAVVRAPAMAYGAAEAAGGVGDARLTVHGKKVDAEGSSPRRPLGPETAAIVSRSRSASEMPSSNSTDEPWFEF